MRKFFYKMKNIPWVNVLIIALVSVLFIGSIVAIGSYVKNDKTSLSSLEFKRGALNDLGFYIESDQSIYTKDLIECQGLEIEPDFETLGTYQVYYYDSYKSFIGKTDKINSQTDGVYVKGDNYRLAKYCRIVITPEYKDEDGHVDTERTIKFYEVAGIAGKFNITVNKDQSINYKKLLEGRTNYANVLGEGFWNGTTKTFEESYGSGIFAFDKVTTGNASHVVLKVATSTLENSLTFNNSTITFPMLNLGSDMSSAVMGTVSESAMQYQILESNSDFTYIAYNISQYDVFCGCVDADSADILEIYLIK